MKNMIICIGLVILMTVLNQFQTEFNVHLTSQIRNACPEYNEESIEEEPDDDKPADEEGISEEAGDEDVADEESISEEAGDEDAADEEGI